LTSPNLRKEPSVERRRDSVKISPVDFPYMVDKPLPSYWHATVDFG
jgi:hypothetical protein